MTITRYITALLIFSLGLYIKLSAQQEELIIKLDDPVYPGMLDFENPKGSISIIGYDGDVIIIAGLPRIVENQGDIPEGLSRIAQNKLALTAETNGNDVILRSDNNDSTIDFNIKVPRRFSLKLKSLDNGNIEVFRINGEIEVENNNGDILIENIKGAAVLTSLYGKITAKFREIVTESPNMFTTFEGDIELHFHPDQDASFAMKSQKGEIFSDLDLQIEQKQARVSELWDMKVYEIDNWTNAEMNGGGTDFIISSYYGNILLKKREE